jgi:iron complex transport system substrate-binding protein
MIPDRRTNLAWRLLAFGLFACALIQAACGRQPDRGGTRRIVSIGAPITETVFALGAGDDVVAVDTSSSFPAPTQGLPKVGYQRTLSAEGILALSPDLVIVSEEAGPPAAIELLRNAGVRVERMPAADTPDEAVARVVAVGRAIDRPAATFATQMKHGVAAALARVPREPGPRFVLVYARGGGTLMVAGTDTTGSAMVTLAGGRNALASFSGYKPVSAEALIAAAPDVIVIPSRGLATLGGEAALLAVPGIAHTPAGAQRRIIAFDDLLLLGFGPRLATAIDELALRLHATTSS